MGFRFMETMFRASMPQEVKYLPYYLYDEDDWTQEERDLIVTRMAKTHPAAVDPMYNTWCFSKFRHGDSPARYSVRRSTWNSGDWVSTDLVHLLDATDLAGCRWTPALFAEVFPDARQITVDEAIAMPFAWYKDDPDYQRDYYSRSRAIWLVDRPHITAILHQHGDDRVFEEQLKFRRVAEGVKR